MIGGIKKITQGFTLIETLVAVLLLSTAVVGPLTVASKGLSAALVARDQMVAFYLAQDAVEYVRFVRDSNKLAGLAWLSGLADCTGASGCYLDTLGNDVDSTIGGIQPVNDCPSASSGGCPAIQKYDDGAGHKYFSYLQGASTPQRYVRSITIATPQTGETTEGVLTVQVSWRAQSGLVRYVTVRENVYDWQ
jgi:prepilin-type N-terminal cleavage/methylation domain-containing protein